MASLSEHADSIRAAIQAAADDGFFVEFEGLQDSTTRLLIENGDQSDGEYVY